MVELASHLYASNGEKVLLSNYRLLHYVDATMPKHFVVDIIALTAIE